MENPLGARFEPRLRQLVLAVDGHSMFYAQQKLGWFFDPRRLLVHAAAQAGLELAGAFWYAGLKDPSDQRPFRDALTSLGFTVRTRPLRELTPPDSPRRPAEPRSLEPRPAEPKQFVRANLDVEVAVDLMMVAPRTDEVWLLSGSRDLDRLVEVLRAQGLRITLISTEGMVARELRNAADGFVDLSSLRPVLEKAESLQQPVFLRN
ncbi:NYN domain-containing protein [Cyanobium sp. LEGE 06113]|uniref:LabA-like NYN domain-containing protein n=1 Tax=Cyanobium sp. LEGE 06113 TaxID=1297573 RepID=UPI00187ECCE8|nr:NYN domain-containing protein [Cyanobium sp. LEGE 06113]MBE9152761.1 NYN domain-containing protein [Cyanobium sp. LEGE 06113]MBE9153034.1 NYN domain-containing protein [Cyanobium sp. LEGE 06113]